MITLSENITKYIEMGDEKASFTFRKPTPQELNKFLAARYPTDKKRGVVDNSLNARCDLFDLLITNIGNLCDETGVIDTSRKDAIPANWKSQLIFQAFEDVPVVDEKN